MSEQLILTREECANAVHLLESLTPDTIIRKAEGEFVPGTKNPFDNHLYTCFAVEDTDPTRDIANKYLEPAIQELAKTLSDIPMIAVRPLFIYPITPYSYAPCYNFPDSVLPLRFTFQYDYVRQQNLVTVDLRCRQIGDYYRTIINGPLHREQMPFVHNPNDGFKFTHKYLTPVKSYGDGHWDQKLDEYVFVRLPGLEPDVNNDSLHRYRVNGDYCYYTGETLLNELP